MKPFFWVREVTKEKSCQNPGHNQYLRTIGAGFSHLPIKHNKEKTLPIKSFCFFYFFTPKRDKKVGKEPFYHVIMVVDTFL